MTIKDYWNKFLIDNNLPMDTKYFDAFAFGEGKEIQDELCNLVLAGKKVATTSVYLEEEEYPHIGSYSIVLDSSCEPRCIIQTKKYLIMPIKEMTYDICKLEGEDDCLDTWLDTHVRMVNKDLDEYGYKFSFEQPIFFEIFEKVY